MRIVVAFVGATLFGWAVSSILLAPPSAWPPLIAAAVIALVVPVWSEMTYGARKLREMQRERNEGFRSVES